MPSLWENIQITSSVKGMSSHFNKMILSIILKLIWLELNFRITSQHTWAKRITSAHSVMRHSFGAQICTNIEKTCTKNNGWPKKPNWMPIQWKLKFGIVTICLELIWRIWINIYSSSKTIIYEGNPLRTLSILKSTWKLSQISISFDNFDKKSTIHEHMIKISF